MLVDEEMYEGEYDDEEMDYEEEMAEDDDDNISDEDEELGGMGEIEGLPGDHGVDLEVILEGGDDDDEDDEDQSDEDEEEESEDIGDDDEHIEIVDEDGNSHPLGEGDDEDDWQSEEDEEEDYEGIAADEEEAARGQGMEHIARGAIGHLVRALGGEGPSDAVEMLQRIEDETMDADAQRELENYLEDGQDEEGTCEQSIGGFVPCLNLILTYKKKMRKMKKTLMMKKVYMMTILVSNSILSDVHGN
jgi:E3 ubiquitin-protein ligase HUWE1